MTPEDDEPVTPEQREWFDAHRANKLKGYKAAGVHLLSTAQVAVIFGVQTATANRWVKEGRFGKPVRVGIRWYISEDLVNAHINRKHGDV